MKRFLLLPLLMVCGAWLAWADDPTAGPADSERVRQFQRNRPLVRELVTGGLNLAAEPEALKRADYCNNLAEYLVREIQEAAVNKEGDRALELGRHLNTLLKGGVADNLRAVRLGTNAGSALELELRRVRDRAAEVTKPLEEQLERASETEPGDMRHTLQAVHDGRSEVEKALKGLDHPRAKE